jgi:tetraacyldisaccharide 4'-kinase
MRVHELWFSDRWGARLARVGLVPFSWLYAAGWQAYLGLYRTGLKRPKRPHRPVLCVGNLTVGGSGKTPVTLHLFDLLRELGRETVVSCSGYGSEGQRGAALAPEGELSASLWGDEAAMLRWLRPELPLVVGRDRVRAAELVHASHPNAVLLLDDGFQHLPLAKDFALVLDEPHPKNGFCLPAGPYREPRANRRRADLVLSGEFRVEETFGGLFDPLTGEESRPQRVHALCALGRPDRFFDSLRQAGLEIAQAKTLPDHDPLQAGTLFDGFKPGLELAVTAKDWVKLRKRPDRDRARILVARHEARIEPAGPFRELLHATLSQAP